MKGTEKEWYLSLRSRKECKGVDGNGMVVAAKIPLAPLLNANALFYEMRAGRQVSLAELELD